jgi:hypothetical protein
VPQSTDAQMRQRRPVKAGRARHPRHRPRRTPWRRGLGRSGRVDLRSGGCDIGLGTRAWRAGGMRGRCGALDAAGTRVGRDAGRGRQNVHRVCGRLR